MWSDENLIKVLKSDGVVVMPTDTLYGIVGRAQSSSVVNHIYEIRKRAPEKPCIVLIGDIDELKKFSIFLTQEQKNALKDIWSFDLSQDFQSSPTSVVFDCVNDSFKYLHRDTKTLALRLPASQDLRDLLIKTGPLIAPSANIEGFPSSKSIVDAQKYFGNKVDLYVDGGEIIGKASRVVRLQSDGSTSILRE